MKVAEGMQYMTKGLPPYTDESREAIMERYQSQGGDSGIVAFEIGRGWITVQFKDAVPIHRCECRTDQHCKNAPAPRSRRRCYTQILQILLALPA
jgi:hypothetical protein